MDARACLRVAMVALVVLAVGCGARAEANTEALAGIDGGFEGTSDGWVVTGATLAPASASPAPHGGVTAGRVTATSTAAVVLSSQVWRVPTVPADHTLALWLYDNDPRIALTVELSFHDAAYQAIGIPISLTLSGDAATWRRVTLGPVTAPAATAFAKVTVRGTPSAVGATFVVDDATLVRGEPTSTPTPTPTPTPTAAATPAPTPAATATAVSAPVPTPPVPAVFASLQNGDFERSDGLFGWTATGGVVTQVTPGLDGSAYAARLISGTASTKFLQQAVTVAPLGWYAGSARVKLTGEVAAAWLRIAWYASPLGEGSQLATVDSNLVAARDEVLDVQTGPVRAPAEAHSARVRIMLRPVGIEPAYVTADDVRFESTAAPVATPTPTPVPTAAATPGPVTPAATPLPPAPPAQGASVAAPPTASATASRAAPTTGTSAGARPASTSIASGAVASGTIRSSGGTVVGAAMLRITELLPDPAGPGADSDFEWVEVANLGREPAALAGALLGDNQGALALPDMTLGAGMVLVIAGRRAVVPEASAYRPAQGFSNGLGNSGDRLALFLPDRTVVDALSYGTDTTYDRPPLPVPAPGSSLVRRFADDGTYAGFEVAAKPSPGVLAARTGAAAQVVAPAAITGGADPLAWGALALIGVGALGAAAVQRYRVARGERG